MQIFPPVNFIQTVVKCVFEHKHLGIWLTPSLCWTKQVNEVVLKANAKLAVLRSVSYLSRSTLDILYKLQIRSVIYYGLCIYYNNLKQSDIHRAGKLTVGALHFTSHIRLDRELGWSDLSDSSRFLGLTLFHKIHLNLTRPLIKTCMPGLKVNLHNTRTNIVYSRFQQNSVNFSKSFFSHFSHRFVTGLADSDRCLKCNKNSIDDNYHYVLNCESFTSQRNVPFDKIELLLPGFKVKSKKL